MGWSIGFVFVLGAFGLLPLNGKAMHMKRTFYYNGCTDIACVVGVEKAAAQDPLVAKLCVFHEGFLMHCSEFQ